MIFSFECKMNIVWRPSVKKFAFFAPDVAVMTDCTYEDFMWHHTMVTVDDNGVGKLFVDGEQQHLEDMAGNPIGLTFDTCMYPQLDVPATLDSPGSCSAVDTNPVSPTCQFTIGKSCGTNSHMGGSILGFDGLVDEVVVYDWDVSQGDLLVPDIMFKMPLYIQPRELEVPTGIQKDLAQGRVLYAKFNTVPCMLPEVAVANFTTAYDSAGLTAYQANNAGGFDFDTATDHVTVNELGQQALVYTGVPFKPPQLNTVTSGGVVNKLPLGGKGASRVRITGAGFAKSPFAKCALVQPDITPSTDPDTWEPRYGPGPTPSIYDNYYLPTLDPTYDRSGLTVYSYSEEGYLEMGYHRDTVSLSSAQVVEYEEGLTKQSNIPPYYVGLGYQRTAYMPSIDTLGPRLAYSMYEQIECDTPPAAFPSDQYTLVVSNDGGLTGASSGFVEVSEISVAFDGQTNLTLNRPWTTWEPYAVSFWMKPSIATQSDALLLDLSDGSGTPAELTYSTTSSTGGYLEYNNDGDRSGLALSHRTDMSAGFQRIVEMWHHVLVLVETKITGTQVTVFLDGEVLYGPNISALDQPVPNMLGAYFIGNVDELKLFKDPPAPANVLDRAFLREPEGAPLLWDYFRFNSDFSNSATSGNGMAVSCTGTCQFVASQAPWEPSILYTVNGRPASEMGWSSMKGGEEIEVTGYNLAPSHFLTCSWGEATPAEPYELTTVFTGGNMNDLCNDGVPGTAAPSAPPPPAFVDGGRRLLQVRTLTAAANVSKFSCALEHLFLGLKEAERGGGNASGSGRGRGRLPYVGLRGAGGGGGGGGQRIEQSQQQ